MSWSDFETLFADADAVTRRDLLRARFRYDLEGFARWCWPDRFDLPFNNLHRELFKQQLDIEGWADRVKAKVTDRSAVAAPRGYAKSTIESFLKPIHDIVYGLEAYIVLGSSEMRLARSFTADIMGALGDSESPLAQLYGPFAVKGGVDAFTVSVRGQPSTGVLARSIGTALRGAKHPKRGIRVTKFVLDDAEDRKRVQNAEQRADWWDWLNADVAKAGPRGGGLVIRWVGTVLHPDAVLARLLKRPGWKGRKWKAIIRWPERADLWERCRRYWCDLTLGEAREAAARAFYEANRDEMDRGAEVLDPETEDLYTLHVQMWSEGYASFLKEKQNEPIDPSTSIFDVDGFRRFRRVGDELHLDTGRVVKVSELTLWGYWDPSEGGVSGDYAAIAVVGRDRYGYCYVLQVWMRRAKPSAQLEAAWTIAERHGLKRMLLEANGFQDLVVQNLPRQRAERREAGRFWQLEVNEHTSTENKDMRIASMEPDTANGWLLFADDVPPEVLQQFREHPNSANDDGADAVHGAWRASGGTPPGMASTGRVT